jgi:hypothetical protein
LATAADHSGAPVNRSAGPTGCSIVLWQPLIMGTFKQL